MVPPPDEDYRRRIQFVQRLSVRDPDEYLLFCSQVARAAETDELPEHMRELRDDLAQCIRNSSHRPLTLDTPQWTNDEWMRDLWFDIFGPEPAPGDPYPVPGDAWGFTRRTTAMRALASHGMRPDCDIDEQTTTWCRTHRLDRDHLTAAHETAAGVAAPEVGDYRPEPPGYRDRLSRRVEEGARHAMPGEEWYTGESDLSTLLEADDHDVWWTEAKRLQTIVDEAATILKVDSPEVLHLCPDEPLDRKDAKCGSPAMLRMTRAKKRRHRRHVPRRFQLVLARQVAAQPDSVARGIIGHEMAHAARFHPRDRIRRRALVGGTYVATVVILTVIQELFSLTFPQSIPIVIPSMVALVAWHSWRRRREELACDVLAASIGMPITTEAAAWIADNYTGHVPTGLRWLVAPLREHPPWQTRLEAIRQATPSPEHEAPRV